MSNVIYIISEFFAPFQNVGSIKFSKIAKYLSMKKNNEIIVFTRKNYEQNDEFLQNDLRKMFANGVRVFYIYEGYFCRFTKCKQNKFDLKLERLIKRLIGAEKYYYDTNQITSKIFVKKGLKIIKRNNLPKPNLVLSTYDDWGGHCLAKELKSKYPDCMWIADFRDPIGSFIKEGKYRQLCDNYSLMVSKNADFVTAVTKGFLDALVLTKDTKTEVVTNGFDFEDYESLGVSEKINDNGKLKFAYTGSFYGGATLLPLFLAIKSLVNEGLVMKENLEVFYAGDYNNDVYKEIQATGLDDIYTNKGSLSRFEAVKLQDEVDVLLTSVWNRKGYQGVMGGKVVGYLMLQKPIIGIVSGNLPDSELKKLILEVNCGWCYEEANHEKDFIMLKKVILDMYNKKMKGEKIDINYNFDSLEKFDLKNIALQYENIYERIRCRH